MKKITVTSIFGIIGGISWILTNFLRELSWDGMESIQLILGIMPNISACWLFIWFGEILVDKRKHAYTFQTASLVSGLILLLAIASEFVHDIFLNSPFDKNDVIATVLAIVVYLGSMLLCTRVHKEE